MYVEGNTVTLLPEGIADVISGKPLTLQCVYSGIYNPFTFNFYLSQDTNGLQIRISNCMIISAVGYNTSLYNLSCGTNNVSLIILAVSQEHDGQKWECDVTFITAVPIPPKASTIIRVTAAITTTSTMTPPSMPNNFFFSHIEGGLLLFGIEKGFNGGSDQTFIVEYQPFGMPEAAWSTVFKINETDLDDPFTNGTYYIKIPKIQDGHYIFRVYAENKKGNSSAIEGVHIEIKTELPSVDRNVPVGGVVGGVVGAIMLVIAIVVVAVVKRRTLKPKIEANIKGMALGSEGREYINTAFRGDISPTEYEALQSDQTGSSQYEALNDQISKSNQSAEISILSDPRPSTGEMLYDKLQPHETNQGHMYSSLISSIHDEGENKIYENNVLVNKIQQ